MREVRGAQTDNFWVEGSDAGTSTDYLDASLTMYAGRLVIGAGETKQFTNFEIEGARDAKRSPSGRGETPRHRNNSSTLIRPTSCPPSNTGIS